MNTHKKHILEDLFIVVFSVVVAIFMAKMGIISNITAFFGSYTYLGIFIAGLFFSSVFTTSPSIAVLATFSLFNHPIAVALVGALGAMVADYIMFLIVKDRIYDDVKYLMKAKRAEKYLHIFQSRVFRRITPIIGAFIIASPLPDELGVTMLGLSKTNSKIFLVVSYLFNAIGILLIGIAARVIAQ